MDFYSEESCKRIYETGIAEYEATGVSRNDEYQLVCKSGDLVDVELSAIAERNEADEISRTMVVLTDITDRKIVEKQFIQAQKMESVGQLTGGLAHDFNNLLGVIMGNLQLIERKVEEDPKVMRRVDAALTAVDKGAELTSRLLAFSRRQSLETQRVDPNPLIEGFGDMLTRTLGENIDLECKLAEDVPEVETDPAQLESAILNLAVNARDAMPNGGTLTIETQFVNLDAEYAARDHDIEPGDYVMLAVTDTGCGIPESVIDQVFEPFFTTKDVGKGSGLGLSMIYGFIKQSGGHVRIYSETDHGTTVRIYLPSAPAKSWQVDTPVAGTQDIVGGTETILVVEDQEEVRDVGTALLEDLGYAVVSASNATEALAILDSNPSIDLLFTDIVMPGGIDGTALAKAAHLKRADLPVVFTTGYAEAAVLRDGDVKTSSNLVTKPYRRDDLAAKIRTALLGSHRTGEEPEPELRVEAAS